MDGAVAWVEPHPLLPRSFADAALARALHFSLSDDCCYSPVFTEATTVADHDAAPSFRGPTVVQPREAPPSARCRLGPAGRRAGKRRARPSKRVPTTYISTDAATFRFMVQHVTGADAEPQQADDINADPSTLPPPFDVEHYLLSSDPAAAASSHVSPYVLSPTAVAEQQPCFPTLDSWNVLYEKNEVV